MNFWRKAPTPVPEPVANGVYFYRLETGDGQLAFGKVVVLN